MKTFNFAEKEVEIIQLALNHLTKTLDGKDEAYTSLVESLTKRLREQAEEIFAAVHSQGG